MNESDLMETSNLRRIFGQVVARKLVPYAELKAAQDMIQLMCREAAGHGFTEADVLRAIFRPPISELKGGCLCPDCKVRRGEPAEYEPNRGLLGQTERTTDESTGGLVK